VCENIIDPALSLPAASGLSAAEFYSISDPVAQSGLSSGNTIDGTVTDGVNPLPGIVVTLMDEHPGWNIVDTAVTDSNGDYSFNSVTAGNYAVRAFDANGAYQREWKDDHLTYLTADDVVVTDSTVANGDMTLASAPAGGLAGRAMEASSGNPIAGSRVHVFHETDGYVGGAITGADGYWMMRGLPNGNYFVWYKTTGYSSQWYQFALLFFNADLVNVNGGISWASATL
jgi:hypothetical protein